MALTEFHTHHFRNLAQQRLQFSSRVNLIWGRNGSGKSSLLEAIHYLSSGRSFRTHKHESVVTQGQGGLTVFGRVEREGQSSHQLGVSRDLVQKQTVLKLDGVRVRSMARLARELPVSVIEPGTFDILAGGPGKRRQFLDWLVFHVNQDYGALWQQYQKGLSQRNHLLRNGTLEGRYRLVWNQELERLAVQVTEAREGLFRQFEEALRSLLAEVKVPWSDTLAFQFYPGWDRKRSLSEVLEDHQHQERKAGYTQYGPHRADIRVRVHGKPVAEVLSRGQQKTLVVLLKLAQMACFSNERRLSGIFLLDDINAELDDHHQRLLVERLLAMGCPVFVTSIEPPDPRVLWESVMDELKMFHVEQGQLTENNIETQGAQEPYS